MPINEDLLLKLKEKVLSEPASFEMGCWKDSAFRYLPFELAPTCKTVGCFAGWTCMLGNKELDKNVTIYNWEGNAAKLLNLDFTDAHDFFHSPYWPFKFREAYHDIDIKISNVLEEAHDEHVELTSDELAELKQLITRRAEIGAKVIDYFILHDGTLYQDDDSEFPDMKTIEV